MAFLVTVFRAFEKVPSKTYFGAVCLICYSQLLEVAIFGGRYIRICQQTLPLNVYGYLNVTRSLKTAMLSYAIIVY